MTADGRGHEALLRHSAPRGFFCFEVLLCGLSSIAETLGSKASRPVSAYAIHIQGYDEVAELRRGPARYFACYHHARPHQSLGDRTTAGVYETPLPRDLRLSLRARGG
jgi:hypothetical protein